MEGYVVSISITLNALLTGRNSPIQFLGRDLEREIAKIITYGKRYNDVHRIDLLDRSNNKKFSRRMSNLRENVRQRRWERIWLLH